MLNRMICALVALMFTILLAACGPSGPSAPPYPVEEPTVAVETKVATVEPPSGPDLVIQSFRLTEPDWFLGAFGATAEVVVKNVGNLPASAFDVGIVGVNRENNYVRFRFEYDPTLTAELTPGQEATLTGKTALSWHGHFDVKCSDEDYDATLCAMHDETTLWLMAIADYCEGDEMPDHCAVEEIDEANNASEPVVVEKPEY